MLLTASHPAAAGSQAQGAGLRAGQAVLLAGGAALFLAGDVVIRRQLDTGPVRLRALAALAVLATVAVGLTAGPEAQLAAVVVVLALPLAAERGPAGDEAAGADAAG